MQTIIGTLLGVQSAERVWPSGDRYIEHTAYLLDGVHSTQVTIQATNRDGSPALDPALVKSHEGERICLEVYGRGGGNKRVYLTAVRIVTAEDLADALGLATV